MTQGKLTAVNVLHRARPGAYGRTGIDKRPLSGPVVVTEAGLDGDRQLNRWHGGPDKAVYAYSEEDADWWATELDLPVPPGLFGENLRLVGIDVSNAEVGERWQIGDVLLEVTMPRTPCENLALRVGVERFHVRFNSTGRVGAMLRVVRPGTVSAGDSIIVTAPGHGVAVSDLATGADAVRMQRLLDSGVPLARSVRAKARRVVRRG